MTIRGTAFQNGLTVTVAGIKTNNLYFGRRRHPDLFLLSAITQG
jgi:hypothetical protein